MDLRRPVPRGRNLGPVLLCLAVLSITVVLPESKSASGIALALSLACTVSVRKSLSPLVRSYIVYLILVLVIAPRFSQDRVNIAGATGVLAALWISSACLGGSLAGKGAERLEAPERTMSIEPVTSALLVSVAGLVSAWVLRSSDSFGVTGQLASGVSGGGYLGLLVQLGPPSAAGALLSTLRRSSATRNALVLSSGSVVLQAVTLAYSGFRGAAPLYLIAIAVCAVGLSGRLRSISIGKRAFAGVVILSFMIGLFTLGASIRRDAQLSAGFGGNGGLTMTNFTSTIIERFDDLSNLNRAQQYRDSDAARSAVSLQDQVAAIIPRAFYSEKPVVDYGRQVSIAIYNEPTTTRNSSTVTTFGDAFINLGSVGAVVLLTAYVFLFDAAFRRWQFFATVRSLSVLVALVLAFLNVEAPAVLSIIGLLRVVLSIIAVQWAIARIFRSRVASGRTPEVPALAEF